MGFFFFVIKCENVTCERFFQRSFTLKLTDSCRSAPKQSPLIIALFNLAISGGEKKATFNVKEESALIVSE